MKKRAPILGILAALGLALLLYAWQIEPRRLTVTHVELPPRLAEAFTGKRIVLISDLHITKDWRKQRSLLALLEKLKPDYLLIGGDLVWYERPVEPVVAFLKRLPPTAGTFAVLGDSDYMGRVRNCAYCHLPQSRQLRTDLPLTFLRNEALTIAEGKVLLVGLDGEDDSGWSQICRETIAADLPTLVLGHYPAVARVVAPYHPDMILAGDTHGGQIIGVAALISALGIHGDMPYAYGRYQVDGVPLFVSRGIGESILPLRLGCPPEVVVMEGRR
ncbi:MAG: metallophosphoesterase [Candidatus Lernaella stagnicola]|nr:metallophosphoesterase [Candidatus Lernaella stagnicola]